MAIVVVVLMIGFIGGSYIQQFARRGSSPTDTIAYYGQEKKITQNDLLLANQELEILKLIGAEAILRQQDLRSLFLGELLFPEQTASAEMAGQILRMIKQNDLRISEKQINDIYRPTMPTGVYWLLLKTETQQAGFRTGREEAGKVLAAIAPKLFNGASYQQVIEMLMKRYGISEEEILSAFGNLLSCLQYARVTCSNENLTSGQIAHLVSMEEEKMDVSFVRFDSEWFTKNITEPKPEQIGEHFNKYKAFFAGEVNDLNPYGFGYKLPETLQLEYLAVRLDDVEKIITLPNNQEMEDHYNRNIEDFTTSYHSDPNDPNSPVIKKPRSFGEVAGIISRILTRDKITTKAEGIIHQAKDLAEAKLQSGDVEVAKLTTEQFKQLSGDYETAAKQVAEKNNIKIYTGKTGLLSAVDMQDDEYLNAAYIISYKANPVPLTKVLFAVDELAVSELGPFDPPKPRLYENIGPAESVGKKAMMLVRVIDAKKPSVPESIDLTFSTASIELGPDANKPEEKIYSVRKNIAEDLKNLAAMDVTKTKAQEFLNLVRKQDWEGAAAEFNKLYPQQGEEPNVFKFQSLTDVQRLSKDMLSTMAVQNAGGAMERTKLFQTRQQYQLLEQFYGLVPADGNSPPGLPMVFEFKPNLNFYCIKDLSVKRINSSEYERLKTQVVYKEDFAQSQAMAAVYFNPENIVKRTNFRWTKKEIMPLAPQDVLPPEVDF